ncbi:MAG: hypothetical protein V1705_02020 [bacterium]
MNFLLKLKFIIRKPDVAVIPGDSFLEPTEKIFKTLRSYFKGRAVLISEADFKKALEFLPEQKTLILNSDNDNLREMSVKESGVLTFGLNEGAAFYASDINTDNGLNFKVNYQGNMVPFWLANTEKEQVLAILAASAAGKVLGLNLVELSQILSSSPTPRQK